MTAHAARLAEQITSDFYEGRLAKRLKGVLKPGEGTWEGMPEVRDVERLRASGATDRQVRLFVTFVAAMDRMRDASLLWERGAALFESEPDVFVPVSVSELPVEALRRRLSRAGVSRRHGPDSRAWSTIARLLTFGRGPVQSVIETGVGDASELARARSRFPMLRGAKIGPMWIRMLAAPGGARIANISVLPVAVDVQVRRATENLGVADTRGMELDEARPVIQRAWRDAVEAGNIGGPPGIAGTCAALDPALWVLGKYGGDDYKHLV